MFKIVALLELITQFLHGTIISRSCVPNTQFLLEGRLCICDSTGQWSEQNCQAATRRQQGLSEFGPWCTPFKYYSIDCNFCICPASGQTSEASCTTDMSCLTQTQARTTTVASMKNYCIPNVIYIFPCLQCVCPEDGHFILEKCLKTCQRPTEYEQPLRCTPGTLFRNKCKVCKCPKTSRTDENLCFCDYESENPIWFPVNSSPTKCVPYSFMKPRCLYCECHSNGTLNENACLMTECNNKSEFFYSSVKKSCSVEEVVSICIQCFCLRNGLTVNKYCSKACNNQNKFEILQKIIKDNNQDQKLIVYNDIKTIIGNDCDPNFVYKLNNKYCLCPEDGKINVKLCTSEMEDIELHESLKTSIDSHSNIDAKCEPNTFVDFDCNTCYCSKRGTIDPKWCTYDDCEAKRLIQESHKVHQQPTSDSLTETCTPGSISKVNCNFCICPDSGVFKERACTKNYCSDIDQRKITDDLTCEPLAYYEVDCNICFCPRDGMKNVAKCTKNHCEKSFLRSDDCIPGQLFSKKCNVCVCPANGNKTDRVCTNHTCTEADTWTSFKLSQSLLENRVSEYNARNLDLCFPGEEFMMGCKHCVCPEMGLKMYANCDPTVCENKNQDVIMDPRQDQQYSSLESHARVRRDDSCYKYNITEHPKHCTPGSMYIIRCKQCICPYMGHIIFFCRPLPKHIYCEQPYPNVNYDPMSRSGNDVEGLSDIQAFSSICCRIQSLNLTDTSNSTSKPQDVQQNSYKRYECDKIGTIMDKCFVCECVEGNVIVEEHCFKSEAESCEHARPSFFINSKVLT